MSTYANILLQNIQNRSLFELRLETIKNLMKFAGLAMNDLGLENIEINF